MKVVLNAAGLARFHSGISVYTRGLLRGFEALSDAPAVDLFVQGRWATSWREFSAEGGGRRSPLVGAARRIPGVRRAFRSYQQRRFRKGTSDRRFDMYHEPNFVPFDFSGPSVLTVHDLAWVRHPQYLPKERLHFMVRAMPKALDRAASIITVSNHVRRELEEDFPGVRGRVHVVHNGVDSEFTPATGDELSKTLANFGLRPDHYLLSVGTIEPRKNLLAVLQVYSMLPAAMRMNYPLAVAGPEGWLDGPIRGRLAQMIEEGSVKFLGFVDQPSLIALYSGARCFVFPSFYEGFGLPVVEAMACGATVVTSNRGSLPEIAGNAALFANPEDAAELADCLERIISDQALAERLRLAGFANADRFRWSNCAAQTMDVYRAACE